jgi:hypothetical protein
MSETRFCKDCKFCKREWQQVVFFMGYEYAECHHPKLSIVSLVDGKRTQPAKFCQIERKDWQGVDVCGPDGKYFEGKR